MLWLWKSTVSDLHHILENHLYSKFPKCYIWLDCKRFTGASVLDLQFQPELWLHNLKAGSPRLSLDKLFGSIQLEHRFSNRVIKEKSAQSEVNNWRRK